MFILEEIWRNDMNPSERGWQKSPVFLKRVEMVSKIETAFHQKLSAEDKDAYDEILSHNNEISVQEACDAFIRGFRMGAQVMLDVFGTYDSPLYETDIYR